mmetsp:Transcript_29769/g.95736  ORF Transcript_29769/g.95736 Transcript_29769/m.95736 type:complete len:628 (-) Transcript_29769:241-2124(-)
MAGGESGRGMDAEHSYITASAVILFMIIAVLVDKIRDKLRHWCMERKQKSLLEVLVKMETEVMGVGVISLLLTVAEDLIVKICVPVRYGTYWISFSQCDKYEYEGGNSHPFLAARADEFNPCPAGKQPLVELATLHELHILMFTLALCHLLICCGMMAIAMWRMREWQEWEDTLVAELEEKEKARQEQKEKKKQAKRQLKGLAATGTGASDELQPAPPAKPAPLALPKPKLGWGKLQKDVTGDSAAIPRTPRRRSSMAVTVADWVVGEWVDDVEAGKENNKKRPVAEGPKLALGCVVKQFLKSVSEEEFRIMTQSFASTHSTMSSFRFTVYVRACMHEDFVAVVGLQWTDWSILILLVLLSAPFSFAETVLQLSAIGITTVAGAKLVYIILMTVKDGVVDKLDSNLFWFGSPHWLLSLIRYVLFVNALVISNCIFTAWQDPHSCYFSSQFYTGHDDADGRIWRTFQFPFQARLVLALLNFVHVCFITIPLYSLAVQMGSNFRKSLMPESIQKHVMGWLMSVREKRVKKQKEILEKNDELAAHVERLGKNKWGRVRLMVEEKRIDKEDKFDRSAGGKLIKAMMAAVEKQKEEDQKRSVAKEAAIQEMSRKAEIEKGAPLQNKTLDPKP